MIVRDFNKIEIKGDKLLKTFIGSDDLAYPIDLILHNKRRFFEKAGKKPMSS